MSKLTTESAREIIEYNRSILYHLPVKYEYLNHYLQGSLRGTLLSVFKFISDKQILIVDHKYIFFADNKTLTYKARKKSSGESTTSRHINLLCALGLFTKQYQSRLKDKLIDVNKNFFTNNPHKKRSINVYSFRRYTEQELKRIEDRARRLAEVNVTAGNFCQTMLACHGLEDLSNESLPSNNRKAPEKKAMEFQDLLYCISYIVDIQGYTTKQEIKDNLAIEDTELDKLFRIFKQDIAEIFYYKRPTKKQMEQWGLTTLKFIYTRKE
jgi:hypothetical protein